MACYLSSVVRILDYFHFRLLKTFLCWFVQGDLYQRKRRLPGSTIGTENLLCRDLLNLVINLMLLSVKDVKTLPFEIVYLHTLFPNNTQKLGHILMTRWAALDLLRSRGNPAILPRSHATKRRKVNLSFAAYERQNRRFASVRVAPESRRKFPDFSKKAASNCFFKWIIE